MAATVRCRRGPAGGDRAAPGAYARPAHRRARRRCRAASPTTTSASRSAGQEYVIRVHGGDTELLGSTAQAERLASEAAAELGIAPACRRSVRRLPCDALRRLRARRLGGAHRRAVEEIARALRRFHDCRTQLPSALLGPRPARPATRAPCASAACGCRPTTPRRSRVAGVIACGARTARAAPLPQRPARGQHHPLARGRRAR